MKRVNTALLISLIIHVLAAMLSLYVYTEGKTRQGSNPVFVEFRVKAPEPRLDAQKPKFEPVAFKTIQRTTKRTQSPQIVKFDQKMDRTTAYRDVIVVEESRAPTGIEMAEEDVKMGDVLPTARGVGAGPAVRGGRSQLVEFVDKSKGMRRIVYCLDVSASMGAANKLNLARNYLKDSLLSLNAGKDMFNIIAFAKDTRIFRPGNMVPVTKENLADAMFFLDQFTPQNTGVNTKTDLLAALMQALEMNPSVIAMVTDGLPTTGVTQPEKIVQSIVERNTGGVRIFAIGMEMDLEQPEAWLMRAIAEKNNGEFQFF